MRSVPTTRGVSRRPSAFTLIELLVVVAVISVLAGLLFPVFARAREKARQAACASNLRQIGLAVMMYAQDNDDRFPYGADPTDLYGASFILTPYEAQVMAMPPLTVPLAPYVKDSRVWDCPDDHGGDTEVNLFLDVPPPPSAFGAYGMSYAYNTFLPLLSQNVSGVTAYGADPPYTQYGPSHIALMQDMGFSWHGGRAFSDQRFNELFCDGHIRLETRAEADALWNETVTPPTSP